MSRIRAVVVVVAIVLTWLLLVTVGCSGDRSPSEGHEARSVRAASSSTTTPSADTSTPAATSSAPSSTAPDSTAVPSTAAPSTSPGTGARLTRKVIVVDPGHNGQNSRHMAEINRMVDAGGFLKACNTTGTAGQGLTEAAFTWQLSGALRNDLDRRGLGVVMTRSDNDGWGPCIDARGQVAVSNHAAALVSIHGDGAAAGGHGFHVIHPAPGKAVSAADAEASAALAAVVRDELVAAGFTPSTYAGRNGLIQRSDLGTLNRAEVPAVMIECGNMRNASDLAAMSSPSSQQRMAAAIAAATARWVTGSG